MPSLPHHPVLLSFVALGLVSVAHAGGYGGAWGKNRVGQSVHIYDQVYVYKSGRSGRRTDVVVAQMQFDEECSWVGLTPVSEAMALDCRKGSASPMRGAYYMIGTSPRHRDGCGRVPARVYRCVKGCGPNRVPLIFIEEPEEC